MRTNDPRLMTLAVALGAGALATGALPVRAADACSAASAGTAPPIVELYTSEGCNSCPPADRWLSSLKSNPAVVALAFHVDYWDRLGWKDRFGSAAYTQRQSEQLASNGARFPYTPQVVVDGRDRPDWPSLRTPLRAPSAPSPVDVRLQRHGDQIEATVLVKAGAPARLAAYWATTEQDHASAVQAGENAGVLLHHDFVVRDYQPVGAWSAAPDAAHTLRYALPAGGDPRHARAVNLVVLDAASGRPLQALKAPC
jgi:hypothetical protein